MLGVIIGFILNKIPTNISLLSLTSSEKIIGNKDAKVTIYEYSDFQCPFCEQFYKETLPELKKEYIDTGKVKIVYKDFPIQSHPEALPASLAANCANEQGKFHEMHDLLFSKQDDWSLQAEHMEVFKAFAKELNLNQTQFNDCLSTRKYQELINSERQEGINLGIKATPSFIIGNQKIIGAENFSKFKSVIDAELAK